jgi:hypothetical protein
MFKFLLYQLKKQIPTLLPGGGGSWLPDGDEWLGRWRALWETVGRWASTTGNGWPTGRSATATVLLHAVVVL